MSPGRAGRGYLRVALLITASLAPPAGARAQGALVYSSDRDYPPYEFLNQRGEPAGFTVDLVRALARELGMPVEVRLGKWPEMVGQFEAGKNMHITDLFYTAERSRRVEYTKPFAVVYDELFMRTDTPNACDYANLAGKQVIVQRASTTEEQIAAQVPGARLVPVDSEPAALRLLGAGFHDCAVVTRVAGRLAIRKYKLANLISGGQLLRPRQYAFAVAKGNLALRDRLNAALLAVEASGEFQKIYDRWFGDLMPPSPAQALLRAYGWWILGALLALVLATAAWNRALSVRVRARTRDLAATARRQHELFNHASDTILVVEPHSGQILEANRHASECFGYSREELLGMRVHDLGAAGTGAQSDASLQRLREQGQAQFERRMRHRDGRVIHAEIRARLVELDGRQVIEGVVHDITERKQAENRMAESEARYAMALEAAGMGSWDWDIASNALIWSDSVETIFGIEHTAIQRTYEAFIELVVPEDRDRVLQAVSTALAQRSDYSLEYRVATASGEQRWLAACGRGFYDATGKPVHMAGLVWDVTRRKQEEIERERLLRDLERRTAEMEGFIYTISHDLKAPLITISGFVRLLEKDLATGNADLIGDSLAEIHKASDGMKKLIQDLLELARTGQIVGEPKEVILAELFADLESRSAQHIEQEQAQVRLVGKLPRLRVDPVRFGQVLQNLIENALTYHRPGVAPQIEIGAVRIDGEFRLYVRDNGVGIPAAYQERIFGLFQRLDTRTEGTGVGLAIARRIVEMHGGRIWVESEVGKGSIFWIALPDSAIVGDDSAVESAQHNRDDPHRDNARNHHG